MQGLKSWVSLPESFELSFEFLERLPIRDEAKFAIVLPIEELCFCFGGACKFRMGCNKKLS